MYQKKSNIQDILLIFVDCIGITISLMIANYIRHGKLFSMPRENMSFVLFWGMCICVFLIVNLMFRMNERFYQRGPFHELIISIYNNLIILVGVTVILYFTKLSESSSRLMLLIFVGIDSVMLVVIHQIMKVLFPIFYRKFFDSVRQLVIAEEKLLSPILTDISVFSDFSNELIGVVIPDRPDLEEYEGVNVITDMEHLVEYCQNASLDEVIIATKEDKCGKIHSAMEVLAEMGITIHYQIEVPELNGARHRILSKMGRMYTVTYANQVTSLGQLVLKRAMDVIGGILGCVAAGIIFIICGPIIKLQSPGPIVFAQDRVGRNGRIFRMYKFRSMYVDAEERKAELMKQNEMSGLMFKMENDPRITPIGKFMRKTSLDEFPQFYNILKGDMSLVGTRPPTLDEFSHYSPYHKKRLSFRPGLTGMWQVSGRNDISDFEEIVKLDVEYIDTWSFILDIKILLKTILVAFTGK